MLSGMVIWPISKFFGAILFVVNNDMYSRCVTEMFNSALCLLSTVGGIGSVVEHRSLAGGLSLSCARPAVNGCHSRG